MRANLRRRVYQPQDEPLPRMPVFSVVAGFPGQSG
jgi:hypothetical protein